MPGIDYRRLSAHQPASGEQHVVLLKNLLDSFQGIVYVPQGGLHRFGRPVRNNLVSERITNFAYFSIVFRSFRTILGSMNGPELAISVNCVSPRSTPNSLRGLLSKKAL